MTIKEYSELLEYIAKNNCWGIDMANVVCERHRKAVKYVEATFDTRDSSIFSVKFRCSGGLEGISFRVDTENDLKRVYEWLDEIVDYESHISLESFDLG